MKIRGKDMLVGRVLHEDDDFITMEIGKRDEVVFHLQQNDEGETVGGDQFYFLLFVTNQDTFPAGTVRIWKPWEE